MITPHLEAKIKDISKIVIMAGDPLRAKKWAKDFLINIKLVNSVRNMLVFTGKTKKGTRVTVMGHGMGLDSIGIYAYELYSFYNVDVIIRFGSAGSYTTDLDLFDVVIADSAYTSSNYGYGYGFKRVKCMTASSELISLAEKALIGTQTKNKYKIAKVHSSSWFYKTKNYDNPSKMVKKGILAVEMEAYALYVIAKIFKKRALTILTISDHLILEKKATPKEREEGFKWMFKALNLLVDNI